MIDSQAACRSWNGSTAIGSRIRAKVLIAHSRCHAAWNSICRFAENHTRESLNRLDMSARTRLFRELKDSSKAAAETGIELIPNDANVYTWKAVLQGPKDTPYTGGQFQLAICVPDQYPLEPPCVHFETKIFHPNVHFKTGEICLDILKAAWSPAWTLQSLCQAIVALMCDPASDSPLNCDAGNLLRAGDVRGYNALARMYTLDHAL